MQNACNSAGVALWSWDVETDKIALDERAHELWGVSSERPVCFEDLSAHIHPADIHRVRADFKETLKISGPYEIDFRILVENDIRWISARGQGGKDGYVGAVLFALFMDITARKRGDETRDMLVSEMSHRIKNLFTIAGALTSIAERVSSSAQEMAVDLRQRLRALSQAQELVRPIPGQQVKTSVGFGQLLGQLVAPYVAIDGGHSQVLIDVPDLQISESTITTIALIVHELATNALKYGALSMVGGKVTITASLDDVALVILWREEGGPPTVQPQTSGFGTKLITQSLVALAGSITYDWGETGLATTIWMNKNRLAVGE